MTVMLTKDSNQGPMVDRGRRSIDCQEGTLGRNRENLPTLLLRHIFLLFHTAGTYTYETLPCYI